MGECVHRWVIAKTKEMSWASALLTGKLFYNCDIRVYTYAPEDGVLFLGCFSTILPLNFLFCRFSASKLGLFLNCYFILSSGSSSLLHMVYLKWADGSIFLIQGCKINHLKYNHNTVISWCQWKKPLKKKWAQDAVDKKKRWQKCFYLKDSVYPPICSYRIMLINIFFKPMYSF